MELLNKRQVFDKIKTHLVLIINSLTLIKYDHGYRWPLLYKNSDGHHCPIGVLLKDEFYSPDFEGMALSSFNSQSIKEGLLKSGINMNEKYMVKLIDNLQFIHDNTKMIEWEDSLNQIEKIYFD